MSYEKMKMNPTNRTEQDRPNKNITSCYRARVVTHSRPFLNMPGAISRIPIKRISRLQFLTMRCASAVMPLAASPKPPRGWNGTVRGVKLRNGATACGVSAVVVDMAVEMVVVKNGWRVFAQTHVRSPNVVWGPTST